MSIDFLSARSISLRAASILRPGITGRVLASFPRVCDLVTGDGAVVALVWDGVGDGALNVVLERAPRVTLPAGTRFAVGRGGQGFPPKPNLTFALPGDISPLLVDWSSAVTWNPQPNWNALAARREQIVAGAMVIREMLATDVVRHDERNPADCGTCHQIPGLDTVLTTADAVAAAYHHGDRGTLARAIHALCGLGPGLTPAGDDWLAGWLLGLRLQPDLTGLADLSGLVMEVAAARTTTLSRAFLACAAAGEADAAWHLLLNALVSEHLPPLTDAGSARAILAHGATSGAAMLAGFLTGLGA